MNIKEDFMEVFDLRSDTITLPSEEMRKVMYEAEVGDDVHGDDPTINRLQELGARITGKEDSLFVPSGSMGNLIPLYINCGRGNEVITHYQSHILHHEVCSLAAIAGVMPVAVPGERGILQPDVVEEHIRFGPYFSSRTGMIEIENSHNTAGGTCYKENELKALKEVAERHSLPVHMDGARLFNAALATAMMPADIASCADTVTFCLSKGLGAPVGSLLCGTREFIAEARRVRKMLGGGMRQAGILAAAGIYALEHNISRLAEDHHHARMIAEALVECNWVSLETEEVETNIIYFKTPGREAAQVAAALDQAGIRGFAFGKDKIRLVTSLALSTDGAKEVCRRLIELEI